MSCNILSDAEVSRIVSFFYICVVGQPIYTTHILRPLRDLGYTEADEQRLFTDLVTLNNAAYSDRYAHRTDLEAFDITDHTYTFHFGSFSDLSIKGADLSVTMQTYKTMAKVLYNCCEDATISDPLYIALNETHNRFAHYIVSRSTEYEAAAWSL